MKAFISAFKAAAKIPVNRINLSLNAVSLFLLCGTPYYVSSNCTPVRQNKNKTLINRKCLLKTVQLKFLVLKSIKLNKKLLRNFSDSSRNVKKKANQDSFLANITQQNCVWIPALTPKYYKKDVVRHSIVPSILKAIRTSCSLLFIYFSKHQI